MIEMLCIFFTVLSALLAYLYASEKRKSAEYLERWRKWEEEYWFLRSSEAIRDNYEISLSWLPRGQEGCIRKMCRRDQGGDL